MVIISESLYSIDIFDQVVKSISEITHVPEFISITGPYARFLSKKNIKSITMYEFDDSKFSEAYEYIVDRLHACSKLSGYSIKTKVWYQEQQLSALSK